MYWYAPGEKCVTPWGIRTTLESVISAAATAGTHCGGEGKEGRREREREREGKSETL